MLIKKEHLMDYTFIFLLILASILFFIILTKSLKKGKKILVLPPPLTDFWKRFFDTKLEAEEKISSGIVKFLNDYPPNYEINTLTVVDWRWCFQNNYGVMWAKCAVNGEEKEFSMPGDYFV
jgi:hypothetical protein